MKDLIEAEFESPEMAGKAFKAVEHETKFRKRGSAKVKRKGKALVVEITADDFSTMRAMVNSYMRLISVMFSILRHRGGSGGASNWGGTKSLRGSER